MTNDSLNKNSYIKYDFRNLITEVRHKGIINSDTSTFLTYYSYDEAGNRFAKTIFKYTNPNGPSEDTSNTAPENEDTWELYSVEIYSRDVSGKELAIYKDNAALEFPVYGLDMIGKLKDDEPYFYIKDHLGSVRVTINSSGEIVNAQDYDAWGYILEGRTHISDDSKFKFTGKERDEESEYDYFGARYYDARIGRWGQVEPLLDKYPGISPYVYSLDNPLRIIDPNGEDPFEIIVRTYIPFDVIAPGFKGDSRGADPHATSFRTEQRITVETDRNVSSTIIQNYNASLSPSILITPTTPLPSIYSGLGEGNFSATASYSSDVNEGYNATVELMGEAHVGVIPSAISPAIDYTFGITILPQKDGSVQVLLSGEHDKFPAYEIYVKDKTGNVTQIYQDSPNNPIVGPFRLFPIFKSQKIQSETIIP